METVRTYIKPIVEENFNDLLAIYCNANNMQYIGTGKYDWTLAELKEKWKKIGYSEETGLGFQLVFLKSNDQLIGECGLLPTEKAIREELELAYLLDESYWRQGLGTEICQELMDLAFREKKVKKLKAGMYTKNIGSARIVQKLGLKLTLEGNTKRGVAFQEYEINLTDFRPVL